MKLPRRQLLHLAAGAAALPIISRIGRAQTYPSRPVRIVVGFAAGGGVDIVPPVRNSPRSRRFSSATRSRSTFRGKRTGNRACFTLRSDA
jgi:hypothetical protein